MKSLPYYLFPIKYGIKNWEQMVETTKKFDSI